MNRIDGAGLLIWFGITAAVALVAWIRAELQGSPRSWVPPVLVILLSLLLLVLLGAGPI